MVKVEKDYVLEGPDGQVTLAGLFGDCGQMVVHHVMFGPDWDAACPICTEYTGELTPALITRLRSRNTAFAMVCRAPLAKITACKLLSARRRRDLPHLRKYPREQRDGHEYWPRSRKANPRCSGSSDGSTGWATSAGLGPIRLAISRTLPSSKLNTRSAFSPRIFRASC
jgi:hypothetical protein